MPKWLEDKIDDELDALGCRSTSKYHNETLNQRENTHGDFVLTSSVSQEIKNIIHHNACGLPADQLESLELIALKIARILMGNNDEPDHWMDIAGYANLISEPLEAKAVRTTGG